jgi:hypothetical protein
MAKAGISEQEYDRLVAEGTRALPFAGGAAAPTGAMSPAEYDRILAASGQAIPTLGQRVLAGGAGALGSLASVLDAPRRALWTLGYLASGTPLGDAWEEASTAKNLVLDLFPDLEDNPAIASAIGIGLEILTDPLTYLTLGTLTGVGKGAQISGKLGATWAHQARAGHRALLQFVYPIIEDGALKIARKQLIRAPKLVENIGYVGRLIRYPRSIVRNRAWTAAGMRAWTAQLEGMAKIAEPLADAGAGVSRQLLRLRDLKVKQMADWGAEGVEEAARLADHLDLPSAYHKAFVAAASDEVLERATLFKTISDTAGDIARGADVPVGQLGGSVRRALKEVDWLAPDELGELRKIVDSPLMDGLMADEGNVLRQYVSLRDDAIKIAEQLPDLERELAEAKATRQLARAFAVVPEPGPQVLAAVEGRVASAKRAIQTLDANAMRRVNAAYAAAGEVGLASRTQRLLAEQDKIPNGIFRILHPNAKRRMAEIVAKSDADAARLFTTDTNGLMHRHFAARLDGATETLERLAPGVKANADTIYREFSAEEILAFAKEPPAGSQIQKVADMFRESGVIDRLKRHADAKAPLVSRRFYQSDPHKWFDEVSHNIVAEVQKAKFMEGLKEVPGLVSREAIDGWFHASKVSKALVAELGDDAYLHPELFHEITRVMTRTMLPSPEGRTAALRMYDYCTRIFKTAVTTPESFLGKYGVIPGFPAYHFRNMYSDAILMAYEGPYSLRTVFKEGLTLARGAEDVTVDAGHLGKMSAADFKRMGIAYGVTFGEDTTKIGSIIGNHLENSRRLGFYMDRIRRGYSPYHAAKACKRVLFDYRDMTNIERQLFRRIVPFWSWLRNNVRLQVGTLLSRPGMTMLQLRAGGAVSKIPDAPAWVRGRMMVALDPDKQTGEERMLTGIGLPVEDIAELLDFHGGYKEWVRQLAFRANPYLKLGISRALDFDVERMRPFDRPTSAPYLAWTRDKPGLWAWLQKSGWVGARERRGRDGQPYYTVNPHFDHFMRSLPSARGFGQLKTFAHPGSRAMKTLGWLTGFREIRYHPDRVRRAEEQSEAKEKLDALRRIGDISIYEIPYARRGSPLTRADVRRIRRGAYGR